MDVSFLITNFNAGEYLAGCLASLAEQELDGLRTETVVVDSCSTVDQTAYLEAARGHGARVIEMDRNLGYAGGCNRGLRESTGRFVFFLNADVAACEGCIAPLIRLLDEDPYAGFVEPRTFLDPACQFTVPEILEVTRTELLLSAAVRMSRSMARYYVRRRVRRALHGWRATSPMSVPTLSGAFLGSRRDAVERLQGFDEGFPLYYEDSDLFRRARRAGFSLVLHPGARAVHFAHRSVATVYEEAMGKWRRGRERYLRKHLGPFSLSVDRALDRLASGRERRSPQDSPDPAVDLGPRETPPTLRWESPPGPFLLELAFESRFLLAAGHLGEGNRMAISPATWDSLRPGEYFLRALDPRRLREHGRWRIVRP